MTSIRTTLVAWLICGFAAASTVAAYGIFRTAREEAGELFDYELRAVALSLPVNLEVARSIEQSESGLEVIADDRLRVEIWDRSGTLIYRSHDDSPPLPRVSTGLQTIEFGGNQWRVFGVAQPGRFVQVAQPDSIREALGLRLALHTIWPLAVFLPAMIALVLFVVSRGLAPARALSALLAARSPTSLGPVPLAGAPVELHPLIDALNDLLQRLAVAAQAQRVFIADAAHELRSPLAALNLQLQAATKDGTLHGEPQTLERLHTRLSRMIRLVHQLLTLARADAEPEPPTSVVSLRRLAEQAIADFFVLAEQKGIDLGLESRAPVDAANPCNAIGDGHGLSTLLNNLLDNAIRYTPPGGKIDVVLTAADRHFGLDVVDTGPGIPAAELPRVLDRFYRGSHMTGTGSGLGLSIAARVAEQHGLTFELRNNPQDRGLTASLGGLRAADF